MGSSAFALPIDSDILVNHDGFYEGAPDIGGLARGNFTYRAKVKLNTGADATGVRILQTLPVGAVFRSITSEPSGISCSPMPAAGTVLTPANNSFNCNVGSLTAANGFKWVDFNVMLPTVATNWEAFASATVEGVEVDQDGGINNVNLRRNFTTFDAADLAIGLTASAASVNNGDPYSYTIQVTNNGPTPVSGITRVSFQAPAGALITGAPSFPDGGAWTCSASGGYPLAAPGTVTCDYPGPLPSNAPGTALPPIVIPAEAAMSGPIGAAANVQGFLGAAGSAPMPDGQKDNNTASAFVNSSGSGYVDMSLAKTANVQFADAQPGQVTQVEYTLTARREAGAIIPEKITVTDTLPPGMTYNGLSAGVDTRWACSAVASLVTCVWDNGASYTGGIATALPQIKYGASITATAPMATGALLVNTATLKLQDQDEPNTTNNTAQAIVTYNNTAQLGLTKSKVGSQLPILKGTNFQYKLDVVNNGPMNVLPGQAIVLTETPDAGLLLNGVSAGWSCTPGFTGVPTDAAQTCTNTAGLVNGATATLTFDAIVNDVGAGNDYFTFSNNATAGNGPGRDGETVGSQANVTVSNNSADVVLEKTITAPTVFPAKSGDEITYLLKVSNLGPVRTENVSLTDQFNDLVIPSDGTVNSSGDPQRYLQGGFISATIKAKPAATVVNCPAPSGNASSRTRTLTCSIDALELNEVVEIEVKILPKTNRLDTGGVIASYENRAAAYSNSIHDPVTGNNQSTADLKMTGLVDLTVVKAVSPLTVAAAGEPVTYTVTTQNQGPSQAEVVTMVDNLPADAFLIGAPTETSGGTCTYKDQGGSPVASPDGLNGGTMTCVWANPLNAKGQYVVKYKARSVGDNPAPGTTMLNTVDVSTITEEIRLDNNHAEAVIGLKNPELDVSIDMSHSNDGLVLGEDTEYTLIIKNTGLSYATQVKVTDAFPASIVNNGVTLNSTATFSYQGDLALAGIGGASASWCVQPATGATSGKLDCTIPLMAPGETLTIKFKMKAESLPSGSTTGTIFHQASVKPYEQEYLSNGSDVLANNSTTDRTSTSQTSNNVDLGVLKQGPTSVLDDGDTANYTITVTNYGRDPQSPAGGKVTDVLPAGLEFVSASAGCTYTAASRTVECSVAQLAKGGTEVFTIETQLDKPYKGVRPLVNKASVSVPGDSNPENNDSTTTTPLKPRDPASIPTLSEWGVILMSGLLALMAFVLLGQQGRLRGRR